MQIQHVKVCKLITLEKSGAEKGVKDLSTKSFKPNKIWNNKIWYKPTLNSDQDFQN